MPRGFCKERKAPSASPAPWSGYTLRHAAAGSAVKPVLPLEFALGVVRRSFWGDEQLGDGKSEWEGGRERKQVEEREREEEQGIGNGKGSPQYLPPKRMDESWSTTENSILIVPCLVILLL